MIRAALSVLIAWGSLAGAAAQESVFKGETCARCHAQIRDAVAPALESERSQLAYDSSKKYDVIVVGAGLGGLTAGYYLRDRNILLLEKESRVGGKVRRESWGRLRYPVAADYAAEPSGLFKRLLGELGVRASPIPGPFNSLYTRRGGIVNDPFGEGLARLPEPDEVKPSLRRMVQDMRRWENDTDLGEMPPMPGPAKITPRHRRLDQITFWGYMKKNYGRRPAEFADQYSRSVFGVGAGRVSALAGLIFFFSDFSGSANVTWDGGPGIISETLADRIGRDRIERNALVTAVSRDKGGWVDVTYDKDGKTYRRRAQAVVMAVPSFISKHLILGLSASKRRALSRVRYSSYAVAIVALNRVLYRDSYDLWSGIPTVFTDFVDLERGRTAASTPAPGFPAQVLEVFIPMGEKKGRRRLLSIPDDELADRISSDLGKIFPGVKSQIHGIRIIRWGHAMPVDYPGYLTKIRLGVAQPVGAIFFAGVDTEMPCVEGAVASGRRAAGEVRRFLNARSSVR